jgi:hypothetical protein
MSSLDGVIRGFAKMWPIIAWSNAGLLPRNRTSGFAQKPGSCPIVILEGSGFSLL